MFDPNVPNLPAIPAGLVYGKGSPLEPILDTCRRIASSDATVLLTGETGTGKEVVARAIHDMHVSSTGTRGAFVPVNCGAIPESLLEAELFGHAKGAFTGAHVARKGRVAMAEAGTLFLDEIGELGLAPQVKLLRLLQEKTYEPVGDNRSVKATFRLIAATNRDLAAEVRAGRFRQDLYYRLFVCPIELPPLRARPMDIPNLVNSFWEKRGDGRPLSEGVMNRLLVYPWPGNVRELENLIERIRVTAAGPVVMEHDLPERYRNERVNFNGVSNPLDVPSESMSFSVRQPQSEPSSFAPIAPASMPSAFGTQAAVPPTTKTAESTTSATAAAAIPSAAMPASATPASSMSTPRPAAPVFTDISSGAADDDFEEHTVEVPNTSHAALEAAHPLISLDPDELETSGPIDLPQMLRKLEWTYIDAALKFARGNKQAAARLLGLRRTTLVEKLRRRASDESIDANMLTA